jgi:hypothetical protein
MTGPMAGIVVIRISSLVTQKNEKPIGVGNIFKFSTMTLMGTDSGKIKKLRVAYISLIEKNYSPVCWWFPGLNSKLTADKA